jgi:hypothetical protein
MGFGLCGAIEIWHRPQPIKKQGSLKNGTVRKINTRNYTRISWE